MPPEYVPAEKLGTYNGVDFEVHSLIRLTDGEYGGEPGCWMYDDSGWLPLGPTDSAATWRAFVDNQNVEVIVFAYDCRYRAREIFHCLTTGFDPSLGG